MASLTDPFEAWLSALPKLGYDRAWIGRNLPALRQRFEMGAQMQPCPLPPEPAIRDRYGEL